MRTITATGRTIDEAINNALKSLGAHRDEVEVKPLDTGASGFLGIFGRRNARVEVGIRDDDKIRVQVVLRNLLKRMNRDVEVSVTPRENEIAIELGKGGELLRGDRGMTVQSLEYLISRIINKSMGNDWTRVVIDNGGESRSRTVDMEGMARALAEKALAEGQDQKTEPLTAQQRRQIHLALRDHPKLTTFSVGRGSHRRVIIALREGVPERRILQSEEDLARSRYAEGRSIGDSTMGRRERSSRRSGENRDTRGSRDSADTRERRETRDQRDHREGRKSSEDESQVRRSNRGRRGRRTNLKEKEPVTENRAEETRSAAPNPSRRRRRGGRGRGGRSVEGGRENGGPKDANNRNSPSE